MYSLESPEVRDFLTKWFGNGPHQIGQKRFDMALELDDYIKFIKDCQVNKTPAFQSVSPQAKIEKIFWEFDSDVEGEKFTYDSPLLDDVWDNTLTLCIRIREKGGNPIIFYSGNRGFHVWVYAFSTKIPYFTLEYESTGKEIYKTIHKDVMGKAEDYKYYDRAPSNVNSLARIPFSIHQKSGNQVIPLTPLRKPYMPKVEDYISKPLNEEYVMSIYLEGIRSNSKKKTQYMGPERNYNSELKVRTCIIEALKTEPTHYARLAFVMDAIYSGMTDDDIHTWFKTFAGGDDYNYFATQYQIDYQRDRVKDGFKPPTTSTLIEWGIIKEKPETPNPWLGKQA